MITQLSKHYKAILQSLGEDIYRDGLKDTPQRAAKAMQFLTRGYEQSLKDITKNAVFKSDISEMVVIRDIELYSMCEHHILPLIGKCHIGYIADGKVLGLSKFARIVNMFASRLQIQETMTQQIADAIIEATGAKGVGIVIEAQHMCMMMRGVEKQNSFMTSSVMLGLMRKNQTTREEFLQFIRR